MAKRASLAIKDTTRRTTIYVPTALLAKLKMRAFEERTSVTDLLIRGAELVLAKKASAGHD